MHDQHKYKGNLITYCFIFSNLEFPLLHFQTCNLFYFYAEPLGCSALLSIVILRHVKYERKEIPYIINNNFNSDEILDYHCIYVINDVFRLISNDMLIDRFNLMKKSYY